MFYEFISVSLYVIIGILSWTSIWIALIDYVSNPMDNNKNTASKSFRIRRNYGSHNYYWTPQQQNFG